MNPEPWTGPRSYRARKKRPCDACRRRKVCCVRESETQPCSLCQMRSQQCTYLSRPNPRRRTTATRTDTTLADTVRESPTKSPTESAESSPQRTAESWVSQFVGLSGDQDPYVLRHCHFDDDDQYNSHSWSYLRVKSGIGEAPAHFTVVPGSHLDAWPAWYPTHPPINTRSKDHQRLVDTYTSVVHASFPLLDLSLLRDSPSDSPSEFSIPLLGAVYTLAQSFVSDLSPACVQDIKTWRNFLYQALPIEARHPRLETLEAWLCFVQRPPFFHRAPTTPGLWSEIGSLVGACHDLGLNVDPTAWQMEPSQKSRRIRIAWALFITDKWAALGLGRPSYLSQDNWSVPMVTEDDFPRDDDDTIPLSAKHIFIAMAESSAILAEVLDQLYTIRAQKTMQTMPVNDLLDLLAHFEGRLETFHRTVLGPLKQLGSAPGSLLESSGTVEFAHQTLEIVVYRALLRHLDPAGPSHPVVRQRARSSLDRAVEFLAGLPVSRLRAYWWSPISRINFAIIGSFMLSMRLTSVEEDEVRYWTGAIDRYRQLLELHSVSFDITRLAARRLELLSSVAEASRAGVVPDPLDDFVFWDICL